MFLFIEQTTRITKNESIFIYSVGLFLGNVFLVEIEKTSGKCFYRFYLQKVELIAGMEGIRLSCLLIGFDFVSFFSRKKVRKSYFKRIGKRLTFLKFV